MKMPKIPIVLVGVIAGGVVLGGGVGAFLIGPKVVGPRAAGAAQAKVEEPKAEAKHEKHEPGFVREYENIIVNPAGAEGSHFLMVTVGVEISDPKVQKLLEERDLQIRDTIISILSSQTMEVLSRPDSRETVKKQLAEGLMPLAGNPKWIEIYLPQFVIQ
jgi:flagellar FliL protein